MPLRARSLILPLLALASLNLGCDGGRAGREAAARTDSVAAASPEHRASTPEESTREGAPVGDPAPAPVPAAKQTAPAPKLSPLPFQIPTQIPTEIPTQLPTLPANLRLPFPLPAGLPTAPPSMPATPKAPVPAPQPATASRVTVFGIQGCGACASLKSKLAARSVPYTYVDIDSAKAGTVPHEAYGKVPKTRVVGKTGAVTWVEGDDAEKIERAYRS
jgi:hypothetical protein